MLTQHNASFGSWHTSLQQSPPRSPSGDVVEVQVVLDEFSEGVPVLFPADEVPQFTGVAPLRVETLNDMTGDEASAMGADAILRRSKQIRVWIGPGTILIGKGALKRGAKPRVWVVLRDVQSDGTWVW